MHKQKYQSYQVNNIQIAFTEREDETNKQIIKTVFNL